MNRLKYLPSILFFTLIFLSCSNSPSEQSPSVNSTINPFMQKYAGGYIVEVNGVPNTDEGELYVLHQNGSAKWLWISVLSNGSTQVKSEKTGIWEATQNKITITIKGNTGNIVETYSLVGDKFVNGDRSLKRTE